MQIQVHTRHRFQVTRWAAARRDVPRLSVGWRGEGCGGADWSVGQHNAPPPPKGIWKHPLQSRKSPC